MSVTGTPGRTHTTCESSTNICQDKSGKDREDAAVVSGDDLAQASICLLQPTRIEPGVEVRDQCAQTCANTPGSWDLGTYSPDRRI